MVSTVDAPKSTTPAFKDGKKSAGPKRSQGLIFAIAALDMSWRLAFVIILPIYVGFTLDKHLHTAPAFMIIGFILAMIGLFVVLKQTVAVADEKFGSTGDAPLDNEDPKEHK